MIQYMLMDIKTIQLQYICLIFLVQHRYFSSQHMKEKKPLTYEIYWTLISFPFYVLCDTDKMFESSSRWYDSQWYTYLFKYFGWQHINNRIGKQTNQLLCVCKLVCLIWFQIFLFTFTANAKVTDVAGAVFTLEYIL